MTSLKIDLIRSCFLSERQMEWSNERAGGQEDRHGVVSFEDQR